MSQLLPTDWFELVRGWDAERCLDSLNQAIAWQRYTGRMFGKTVNFPRQTAFYSDRVRNYQYSGTSHPALPLPPVLQSIQKQLEQEFGLVWDGCLCNYYQDGSEYMGWHADDEKVIDQNQAIILCSYGASRRFGFRPHRDRNNQNAQFIELGHGDMLMMKPGCQQALKHALPATTRCHQPRISLTWRRFL